MKALIIGATGATGKDLVSLLLADSDFSEVHVFVRKSLDNANIKLKQHLVDFDQPENWQDLVSGDVAFSCLGTTLKAAGSMEAQKKVDFTYQLNFAKAAKENAVPDFVLVSAFNADSKSKLFYSKIKGELEESVKALHFEKLSIFKPGMLKRENSDRTMENISLKILNFLNRFGILKSQKPLPTKVLAKAMINASKIKSIGTAEICLGNIFSFARKAL